MNDTLSNKTYIFIILYLLVIVYIFLNYSYSNESPSNYWTIIGALAQGAAAVGTFCVLYTTGRVLFLPNYFFSYIIRGTCNKF